MKKQLISLLNVFIFMTAFSFSTLGRQPSERPLAIAISPTINCIPNVTDVCVGGVITYSATSAPGVQYFWNVTGGTAPVSTSNSFTVTWGNTGAGTVTLVVKDNLGVIIHTCIWDVDINPLPNPEIISSFSPTCPRRNQEEGRIVNVPQDVESDCFRACDTSTVVYTTPFNTGSSYVWNVAGDISHTVSGNTVTVNWGAVGVGSVTVIETSQFGCIGEAEACVEIIESPEALFETFPAAVGGVVNICLESANLSLPVNFVDLSAGTFDSPIVNWLWDFGDGSTSSDQNVVSPGHQFPGTGTYDVWLFVENECHCTDSFNIKVIVSSTLGPDITCPSTICAGGTETYSTSADCSNYNWVVTGGVINNIPPYGNSIDVTWDDVAAGTITLDVSGCTASYCTYPTSVYIPIIPTTTTINGPDVVCAYSFNTYSLPNLPGCTYEWSISPIGSGFISGSTTSDEITIYWYSSGTIEATYFNPELGCEGTAELSVEVKPSYSTYGDANVCVGESSIYTASVGSFDWTVVDESGNSVSWGTGIDATINWTTAGNYQVIATDNSSNYCNSPETILVTVHPAPPAPTYIDGPDLFCEGIAYTYTSSPTSAAYYLEWSIPSGGTPVSATGNSITVVWTGSGPYTVELMQVGVNDPNCSSSVFSKTVNPKTLAGVAITGAFTTCTNSYETYTASPLDADDYQWTITPDTRGSIISGQGSSSVDVQWNNTALPATLTLVASSCNNSVTVDETINLTGPPVPTINSVSTECSGTAINFTSSISGSAYVWDFGDNTGGTGNSINHTYNTPGNYTVTLTVTDPSGCIGTSSTSKFITIKESPEANLTTPDPTLYCIGAGTPINTEMFINYQFGNTYQWYGPGGALGTGLTEIGTIAGPYYVDVTSSNGCMTTSNIITIIEKDCNCLPVPIGTVDYTIVGPLCNVVDFSGFITSGIGSIDGWNFGDPTSTSNTSTLTNPNHTYDAAGYYNVSLTAYFPPSLCPVTEVKTIVIPAVADFEWEVVQCTGTGYVFDFYDLTDVVSPYAITNYNWSFGGSSIPNPSGIVLTPGLNTVSLTITSSGSTTCTVTHTIDVPNLPVASFIPPGIVCDGNPVLFTDNSTGNIVDWLWNFGDGASSKLEPTTNRTYSIDGTYNYNVSLLVTDEFGCTSTTSQPITVIPNTLVVDVLGGPDTICNGDSVELTTDVTGGSLAYNYLWSNLENTTSIFASQNGEYSVTVTDNNGCIKTSSPFNLVVNAAPTANIVGETEYCLYERAELSANQGPSNTYQWYVDGSAYTTSPDFSYNLWSLVDREVVVIVTAPNGCSSSDTITIIVHPNPLTPTISVSSSPACSGDPITLTASNTQGLTQYVWNTGQDDAAIIVSSAGTYSVTVFNEFGCSTESATTVVTSMPDFSLLMTGCYELCDTSDVLWVGPIGSGYTYQWLYNSSPILAATNADYLIPAGASGVYQLIINNNGCIDTSDYIDISFIPCGNPCEGQAYIKNIVCGKIDDNGNQTYIVDVAINNTWTNTATATFTTPNGTLSGVPATVVPGYNWFTATYTELVPGTTLCIDVLLDEGDLQCFFELCFTLPECESSCDEECDIQPVIKYDSNDDCTFNLQGYNDGTSCPSQLYTWDIYSASGTLISSLSGQNVTYTFPTAGSYKVCLTIYVLDDNGKIKCKEQECIEVNADCEPCDGECDIKPLIKYGSNDDCTFNLQGYNAGTLCPSQLYTWDIYTTSGTLISSLSGQNVTYTFPTADTYVICLTIYVLDEDGEIKCRERECIEVNAECDEVAEKATNETLRAWPNPSNGLYYLNISAEDFNTDDMKVYNAMGDAISFTSDIQEGLPFVELDTDKPGIYFFILQKGDELMKTTLIKY